MTRIEEPIDGVDYHQFYVCADATDTFPTYQQNHRTQLAS